MLGMWVFMMRKRVTDEQVARQLPQGMNLVEIGPGQGELMFDIIRTNAQLGNAIENLRITLIEPSENLRRKQQDKILKALHKYAKIFPKYESRLSNTSHGRKETFTDSRANFTLDWFDSLDSFIQERNAKFVSISKAAQQEMKTPS